MRCAFDAHHRELLHGAVEQLETEAMDRRHAAAASIAELLVDAAAVRRTASAAEFADAAKREALVAALRQSITDRAQRCTDDLLALYGFRQGDADEAPLRSIEGRWTLDFFEPEAMKAAGLLMGKGVVAGAAVGVVADLALAGLSLGAGAALGGAIGGAVSQGWGPFGRKLLNMMRDVRELSIEDSVLVVMAAWQIQLAQALERRGHAATERIAIDGNADRDVATAVRAARPARSHPEWESTPRWRWTAPAARAVLVAYVALPLEAALSS